jgi:hypothetical protein
MNLPDLPLRLILTLASKASQGFVTRPKRQCALSCWDKVNVSSVSFDAMAAHFIAEGERHQQNTTAAAVRPSASIDQATLTHPA